MTIKELVKWVELEDQRIHAHFGLPTNGPDLLMAHMVKVMEELGELSEQILISHSLQVRNKRLSQTELAAEIADVLLCTLMVARDANVDVDAALKNKLEHLRQRWLSQQLIPRHEGRPAHKKPGG